MPVIGPGFDDPEYDSYDPAWHHQDTPFRRWLTGRLTQAGSTNPVGNATLYAPANRYNGLSDEDADLLAVLTRTTFEEVRAAHKDDLADWGREQQLRNHPDLAVLDVDLDRTRQRA